MNFRVPTHGAYPPGSRQSLVWQLGLEELAFTLPAIVDPPRSHECAAQTRIPLRDSGPLGPDGLSHSVVIVVVCVRNPRLSRVHNNRTQGLTTMFVMHFYTRPKHGETKVPVQMVGKLLSVPPKQRWWAAHARCIIMPVARMARQPPICIHIADEPVPCNAMIPSR